jgi:hypothetical protein
VIRQGCRRKVIERLESGGGGSMNVREKEAEDTRRIILFCWLSLSSWYALVIKS